MRKICVLFIVLSSLANGQSVPPSGIADPRNGPTLSIYDWTAPLNWPNDATKFLRGDRTWSVPPAPAGGLPLANIIPGCDFGTGVTVQNQSIWVRFPHFTWTTLPATGKWKLRFRFSSIPNGAKIGNMVIVRSNRYSNGVGLATTFQSQVTIGGISNPVLAANVLNVDTDPIAVTIVDGFDYWFIVFFINDVVNNTAQINHNQNAGAMMGTNVIAGDQTAAALTPAITDTPPLSLSQVNLVTNVLAVP